MTGCGFGTRVITDYFEQRSRLGSVIPINGVDTFVNANEIFSHVNAAARLCATYHDGVVLVLFCLWSQRVECTCRVQWRLVLALEMAFGGSAA